MVILGITDSFTSRAAIVIDDCVVAALNEERLDLNKMSWGFPNLSIAEVMRIAKAEPSDLDSLTVAMANLFWRPQTLPYVGYFREKKVGIHDTFV